MTDLSIYLFCGFFLVTAFISPKLYGGAGSPGWLLVCILNTLAILSTIPGVGN